MSNLWVDGLGWAGAALMLIAYSAYYGAYPSAFVNVVWIGIAIAAVARARFGVAQ